MNPRHLIVAALFLTLYIVSACASGPTAAEQAEEELSQVQQEVERAERPDFSVAPEDFSRADVLAAAVTPGGPVVLLRSPEREAMLPIFIDTAQALAIQLRLEGETFQRPLTHDLVDNIIEELGASIGKVHVHSLQDSTFFATIFLSTPTGVLEIDARPSDAIALAVGGEIPIYVAHELFDELGLPEEDLRDLPEPDPEDFHDAPTTPL